MLSLAALLQALNRNSFVLVSPIIARAGLFRSHEFDNTIKTAFVAMLAVHIIAALNTRITELSNVHIVCK